MYGSNSSFQGCVFPLSHEYQVTREQHFLKPEQLEQWPNKLHYWTTQGLWASNVVSCYPVKVQRYTTLHSLGQKVDNNFKCILQRYLEFMTLFLLQNIKKYIWSTLVSKGFQFPFYCMDKNYNSKSEWGKIVQLPRFFTESSLMFGRRKKISFGTTWGWVNDDSIFIFGCTMPLQYFTVAYILKTLAMFFQNFTHKSKNCTHKMLNDSHLLQKEAMHSKYNKHISKANICRHLW